MNAITEMAYNGDRLEIKEKLRGFNYIDIYKQ